MIPKPNSNGTKYVAAACKAYKRKKPRDARKQIVKLLAIKTAAPELIFRTALAAFDAADMETAEKLYHHIIDRGSGSADFLSNVYLAFGVLFFITERTADAIEAYRKSLSHVPDRPEVLSNLGLALTAVGQLDDALISLSSAHSQAPTKIDNIRNLGQLLQKMGRIQEAVKLYQDSLVVQRDNAVLHVLMANVLKEETPLQAIPHLQKAIRLQPNNIPALQSYSEILALIPDLKAFEGLEQDLVQMLSHDDVNSANLVTIVRRHIHSIAAFAEIQPHLAKAVKTENAAAFDFKQMLKIISHPVFILALGRLRLIDPEIEKFLEVFRRHCLLIISSNVKIETSLYELLRALLVPVANYCFANEYVFFETDVEQEQQSNLEKSLAGEQTLTNQDFVLKFLILCCYKPANRLSIASDVKNDTRLSGEKDLAAIVISQISEPADEQALKQKIKQITPIDDQISKSVQTQYEQNPYPRWASLPAPAITSYKKYISATTPFLRNSDLILPKEPNVLIAGCGTGRQPISTARSFPETNVLAVDLSLTSIAYAMRKTKELGINNITYGQADIMELGSLNRKFNIVECAGVLHHMNDPVAGWRVLVDLLDDSGYMMIGLYSEIGRKEIVASRNYIQENKYGDSIQDIRQVRKSLMALDDQHPAKKIVRQSDFYTTSACRDLIFHVQEHRFTLLQIEKALASLKLEFLGFKFESRRVETDYRAQFPNDVSQTNLQNWHEFEKHNPQTFATMYKFWVRKKPA